MFDIALILLLLYIVFTLFVVLVERKLLAHAQRRFGPAIAGRNGWLQVVVDLIKLASKSYFILPHPVTALTPALIVLLFSIQLLFIQNFVFLPSGTFFKDVDGLIFFHLILAMLSNFVLVSIGFLSQSKYSLMGVVRLIVHIVSMDVYITLVYVLLILNAGSGHFHDFVIFQYSIPNLLLFAPASYLFIIVMLLEAKRAPFDHVETESEVVAGYATEFSGIFLLTFYLVEYFHLVISAVHMTTIFLGGWIFYNPLSFLSVTIPRLLPIILF